LNRLRRPPTLTGSPQFPVTTRRRITRLADTSSVPAVPHNEPPSLSRRSWLERVSAPAIAAALGAGAATSAAAREPAAAPPPGARVHNIRALHSTFMAYQDRTYPQKSTLYARGQVWGFAGLALDADSAEITILSIPDDGSSTVTEEFRYRFQRRSGRSNAP
jgi:hypothetical protein